MPLPDRFREPAPVPFTIESPTERELARDRLDLAARESRYSDPGPRAHGFLRLSGTVAATTFRIRARPYVVPGLIAGGGAMAVEVEGVVESGRFGAGTILRGSIRAPVRRRTIILLGSSLVLWVAFGLFQGGALSWFVILGAIVLAVLWAAIIRHNQRAALGRAHEVEDFLREVIDTF